MSQAKKPTETEKLKSLNADLITKINELQNQPVNPSLESLTVFELAAELHRRFGVYTAFTNVEPADGDIHPLTASEMTRYEHGLTYQLYKKSRNVIDVRDYEADNYARKRLDEQHKIARDQGFTNPMQPTYSRADDTTAPIDKSSYEYRTSVHGEQAALAGEAVSDGQTVAPESDNELERREDYRRAVARSRAEADTEAKARAADYARRTSQPAFDEAPSPETAVDEARAEHEAQVTQANTPIGQPNANASTIPTLAELDGITDAPVVVKPINAEQSKTVREVLQMEGLDDQIIKEPNLYGQTIQPY